MTELERFFWDTFLGALSPESFYDVNGFSLSTNMKHTLTAILLILFFPYGAAAAGAGCAGMAKELQALRLEYHTYGAGASGRSSGTAFEDLTKILDRIVELKNAMRKAGCPKIPQRTNTR